MKWHIKWGTFFGLLTGLASLLMISLLLLHLYDLCTQYNPQAYIASSIWSYGQGEPYDNGPSSSFVGDKIIVMASLEKENTSWVAKELPDWKRAIYIVNPSNPSAQTLTTPMNKGHEAMAYLTYIIDNYDTSLPSIVAFLHSHRWGFFEAWHVDTPLHDNVQAMRSLRLDFVAENGYVNLRCNLNPGCTKDSRTSNPLITRGIWQEVFGCTSSSLVNATDPTFFRKDRHKSKYVEMDVATPCCAQFAVSREQILQRPLVEYIQFRRWLLETEKDDAHSGRVMEYLWHIIFGKDAVYCPDQDTCYCQVYGRC